MKELLPQFILEWSSWEKSY